MSLRRMMIMMVVVMAPTVCAKCVETSILKKKELWRRIRQRGRFEP